MSAIFPLQPKREIKEILKDALRFFRTKADFWFPYKVPENPEPAIVLKTLVELISLGEFRGKEWNVTLPYYLAGVQAFIYALKGRDFAFHYIETLAELFPVGAYFIKKKELLKAVSQSAVVGVPIDIPPQFIPLLCEEILGEELTEIAKKTKEFSQFLEKFLKEKSANPVDPKKIIEEFKKSSKKEKESQSLYL